MTRTAKYKIFYFGYIAVGVLVGLSAISYFHMSFPAILGIAAFFLLPGRVLGYFWRDLLRGLRLLNAKEFAESKRHSELFLAEVHRRPWLKHMIWLGSGTYSRDPEAMALNNLGAAEIGIGEVDLARKHLEASIAVDGQNPLPFYNIGMLCLSQGDVDEAESWLRKAVDLGYSRDLIDKIISSAQSRFSLTDGQGRT